MHTTISGVEEVFGQKKSRGTQVCSGARITTRNPSCQSRDDIYPSYEYVDSIDEQQQRSSRINNNNNNNKGVSAARCYGCGVALQTDDPESSGYVNREKFEEKARHRQLDHLLCVRCQDLSHGKMIPGVEDFAQLVEPRGLQKRLATPQELREELQSVRSSRALIVLLVDLLDFSGSLLSRVRDLVGKNPIIAVGTKMDLLPRHVDCGDAFFDWFEDSLAFKKLSVVSMHVVSSKTGEGIDEVAADIKQERLGRDVYIIGAANVGKSAFVRAFVKEMASMTSRQFDPLAIGKSKRLPVESSMPGTTLSSIPLEVFHSGGTLYDTPGLHLHHRLPHILTPDENKELHPRKRVSTFQAPEPCSVSEQGDMHACYCWGGLVRIHVIDCPPDTTLSFYGPQILRVEAIPYKTGEILDIGKEKTADAASDGGFGAGSVAARGGLRVVKRSNIKIPFAHGSKIPVADIAVSGIPGWVNISSASSRPGQSIRVIIEAPVGIEAFVRPPIPLKLTSS